MIGSQKKRQINFRVIRIGSQNKREILGDLPHSVTSFTGLPAYSDTAYSDTLLIVTL